MVKTKRGLILAASFVSGLAVVASLVSLGTENWVVSDGIYGNYSNSDLPRFEYGLFQGIYRFTLSTYSTIPVSMTCLYGENVCAMLCSPAGTDAIDAKDILEQFYNDPTTNLGTNLCASTQRQFQVPLKNVYQTRASGDDRKFINTGVWLSTIIFLVLSAVCGCVATGVAIYNTTYNPIEVFFSITGIYIYNGIAFLFTFIYMLLWGVMFAVTLKDNVCVQDTLSGDVNTEGRAELGYSYWINIIPLVFYLASCVILYVRQYLIEKEPNYRAPVEDSANPDIYIY